MPRRRGGKRHTMLMMFVGGSVENLRGGRFLFPPEPLSVFLLTLRRLDVIVELIKSPEKKETLSSTYYSRQQGDIK